MPTWVIVILSLLGGAAILGLALILCKMSKDVVRCSCGSWAELEDVEENHYIFKCHKCGKRYEL